MKTARLGFTGLCFAFLFAACSGSTSSSPGTGGTGNTGPGTGGTGGSVSCPSSNQMVCGGQCLDVSSDSDNCGGCGIPCLGGHTCQGGTCHCPAGLMECNGSCVPSDATNCGSCGMACGANQVCANNQCTSQGCGALTMCGTACVDTTTSGTNCGSCGHTCTSTQHCAASNCVDNVTTGTGGTAGGAGASGSGGTGGSTTGTGGNGPGTGGNGPGTGGGGPGTGGSTAGTGGTAPMAPKLITSAPNAYWTTTGSITSGATGNATVTVNDTTAKQTWEGFGGAFNEAGWAQIMKLSTADQTKAMQLLFDANNGAHFVMGRIPIGASDYALTRYTEDETSGDTALSSFSTTRDSTYLIPYVRAALAVNGSIRFWASPWTPPTWMKTFSGSVSGVNCAKVGSTNFDGGCMQDIAANLTALANYFIKWIAAYKSMGITIDTLAPQNEPDYAQGYPTAIWAPALYTKFFGQLGAALNGMGVKLMLGTMSNGDNGANSLDLKVVQAVMADSTAKGYAKVMGLQWGMLDLYEGKSSGIGPSNFMTSSISSIWATEHKCGNYPWNPSGYPAYKEPAPNDQAYGVESWGYIRDAINKGGVTAYNAWNMVLDPGGKGNDTTRQWSQDSLLVVNGTQLVQTPAYYVFRHASQYAQVGAKVVTTTGGDAIAFKNPDGSVVAVMYNSGSTGNYVVQIKGQKYQFSMPGTGWATVVIP